MKIEPTLSAMIQDIIEDDDISDSQLQSRIYDVIELSKPNKYSEDEKYEIFWDELSK